MVFCGVFLRRKSNPSVAGTVNSMEQKPKSFVKLMSCPKIPSLAILPTIKS
jgi:hypothetical protein